MTLLKLTAPGRPGHLPGRRAARSSRSSTRTTAARSTGSFAAALLASGQPPPKLEPDSPRRSRSARAGRTAFALAYEPVEAGADVCAFLRGGDVLVAVAVRGDLSAFQPPGGTWDDVLRTPHLLLAERAK